MTDDKQNENDKAAADLPIEPFATDPRDFNLLDADFIRVLEDVVDILIDKGLLRLTDFPAEAQRKLLARKNARQRLRYSLDLLSDHDVI